MTPIPKFLSTCRLCQKEFSIPSFSIPLINGQHQEDPRLWNLVVHLAGHLQRAHGDEYPIVASAAQQLTNGRGQFWTEQKTMFGLSVLCRFSHEDPVLQMMVDASRLVIHVMTRKYYPDDATLLDQVARLELSAADQQKVFQAFKEFRDWITEIPAQAQKSVLVAP